MTPATPPAIQKKICMLGGYAVGKTSLVRKYVESIFDERYLTTMGVKIDKKQVIVNRRQVTLVLWDLAGEDDLAQIRPSHLRGASGYILVADGCRESTLEQAIAIQEKSEQQLGPVPFVLAINKVDLAAEWQIRDADVEWLAQTGWTCLRTSAKTGVAVEELFLHLAQKMLSEEDEPAAP
jgi:small GTP-binding protein